MQSLTDLPDVDIADKGEGPAIVFSHGTLLDRTMFAHQTADLSGRYRTIAYTSRAGTSRYGTERTIADLVEDCLAMVDAAGIDRFVLVGMSVGGFMATDFALRYPDRVAGLVLMSTQAASYTAEEHFSFGGLLDPLDSEGLIPESVIDAFKPVIFSEHAVNDKPGLVSTWTAKWRQRPARSLYGEYRSWIDKPDRSADLVRITAPVLIVHGEDDNGISVSHAYSMHKKIPGSEIAIIANAGHLVTEEQPVATTDILRSWLDRKPSWVRA